MNNGNCAGFLVARGRMLSHHPGMIRNKSAKQTDTKPDKKAGKRQAGLPKGVIAVAPPSFRRERALIKRGVWPIAGCDEAGRGPLAGPVVAAAVVLDPKRIPKGIDDSKRLTAERREELFEEICATSSFAVAFASPARIDRDGAHPLPVQPLAALFFPEQSEEEARGQGIEEHQHHVRAQQAHGFRRGVLLTGETGNEATAGCMISVMTPESVGTTRLDAIRLRDRLLFDHDIEVQVHARAGRVWVRVSAQAYNEFADIEALGRAV